MAREESRGRSIGRTLKVLAALMNGERLDATTVGKRLGINPEAGLRILGLLETHVPGVTHAKDGKKHVYRFEPTEVFGKDPLLDRRPSLAAGIAATLGAAFSRVFAGTHYQTELVELRQQVVTRLAAQRKQQFIELGRKFVVVCGGEEVLGDRQGLLDDVVDAILSQKSVRMLYQRFDRTEENVEVKPYSLAVYDAHLYVLGTGKRGIHPYRFGRIKDLSILSETFAYPAPNEYDPEVLFRDSIGIWLGDPGPQLVRIRLSPTWSGFARHHRWHQSQRIVAETDDGSVEIELRVKPCPEFEQWVLRFGDNAEVLEPDEVRARIAARLRAAVALYG